MDDFEADIQQAIDTDLNQSPTAGRKGLGTTVPFRVKDIPAPNTPTPDRAMDQLALAISGLLQAEQELIAFAQDLVGPLEELATKLDANATPSSTGPLIPRLRSDAELLARLAIRLHKLTEEMRQKL